MDKYDDGKEITFWERAFIVGFLFWLIPLGPILLIISWFL